MKLHTWMMAACLGFGSLSLSAQTEIPADIDKFSYGYGVLLGKSFSQQGISWDKIDKEDLMKGIEAMMTGKNVLMDEKAAQTEVQAAIAKAQSLKEVEVRAKEKAFFEANAKKAGMKSTPSGIQYEVLKEGTGAKPTMASKVRTHYHGTLLDGTVFDSSVERGQPISFPLGNVIKGWQESLQLMNVGSKYRIYIPFDLAYGARGSGKVPAFATLIFEVELLGIE